MKRRHGLLIAVVLGAAAVAGTSAMLQTVSLGADAKSASEKEIAKADMRLDRQEAKLRRAAKRRPPKLPKVPDAAPAPASTHSNGWAIRVRKSRSRWCSGSSRRPTTVRVARREVIR